MERDLQYAGSIQITDGMVDITDPLENRGSVYRLTDVKVHPGKYNCFLRVNDKGAPVRCRIVAADGKAAEYANEKIASAKSWRFIGAIETAESGYAGFFNRKPDFDSTAWMQIHDWMQTEGEKHTPYKVAKEAYISSFYGKEGFWTAARYGDAATNTVHAIRCVSEGKREIVALEIRFCEGDYHG